MLEGEGWLGDQQHSHIGAIYVYIYIYIYMGLLYIGIVENQMEKNMENEMEPGVI